MAGNVVVSGSPGFYSVTFQGLLAGQAIPNLIGNSSGLAGTFPGIQVGTLVQGGSALGDPTTITSVPNTVAARDGNNAHSRVIINGSQTGGGTGFEIEASHCSLDGLIIDGFGIGVSVPNPSDVGNLIQGNFIGNYLLYPVDPSTGGSVSGLNAIELAGLGNSEQGVYSRRQQHDHRRHQSPGKQRDRRQPGARHMGRCRGNRQRDRGQPDRHDRSVHQRPLLSGRQRRGRRAGGRIEQRHRWVRRRGG